jgi:hypothetical protein
MLAIYHEYADKFCIIYDTYATNYKQGKSEYFREYM